MNDPDPPPGWHHDGQGAVRWWTGTNWQDAPPRSSITLRRIAGRLLPHREEDLGPASAADERTQP